MSAQSIAPGDADQTSSTNLPAVEVVDERDRDALESLEAVERAADGIRGRLIFLDAVARDLRRDLRNPSGLDLLAYVEPLFFDESPTCARRGLPLAELVAAVTGRAIEEPDHAAAFLDPTRRRIADAFVDADGGPSIDRVKEIRDELDRLDDSYRRRSCRLRESRAVILGRLLTLDGWTAGRIAVALGMTEADLGRLFEADAEVEEDDGDDEGYRVVENAKELQQEWITNGGNPDGSTDHDDRPRRIVMNTPRGRATDLDDFTAPGPSPICHNGNGHAPPDDPARVRTSRQLVA